MAETSAPRDPAGTAVRASVLAALALLYTSQGVPFGLASKYLPVVLREAGWSRTAISVVFWLQLPWQLKVLWARVADVPSVRRRSRVLLALLQLALAATIVGYAPFDPARAPFMPLLLTALAALFASTQDVFVDAAAVRLLRPEDRGFGNIAQVAGYRAGMLAGGGGLLLLADRVGVARTYIAAGVAVALCAAAAFALRTSISEEDGAPSEREPTASARARSLGFVGMLRHVVRSDTWPVIALAATARLGAHAATGLIEPMVVDAHWSKAEIGATVVTVGTVCALLGAALGGTLWRATTPRKALAITIAAQALGCAPFIAASMAHAPHGLTAFAIAAEHLSGGAATTVLFAALMEATRPADAGLHYTVLTGANSVGIGAASLFGALLADRVSEPLAFAAATVVAFVPLALVGRWPAAAAASATSPPPAAASGATSAP